MISAVEGILSILQNGRSTGTNKFGLLLALIDLAPQVDTERPTIQQRDLALKLIEIHWDHGRHYGDSNSPLRQVAPRNRRNTQVLIQVDRLRALTRSDSPRFERAIVDLSQGEWDKSLTEVREFTRKNALGRLQYLGSGQAAPFLFHPVAGSEPVHLLPGVAEQLTTHGPLLRTLVEARFVEQIMIMNRDVFEQVRLHDFLFGDSRHMPNADYRKALLDLQGGRCIYSGRPLSAKTNGLRTAMDHVLAWSRVRLSVTQNLVLTTASLNTSKRELLLDPVSLEAWLDHLNDHWSDLDGLGVTFGWPSDIKRTVLIARGLYANVPEGTDLWSPQGVTWLDSPTREKCLDLLGFRFAWDASRPLVLG